MILDVKVDATCVCASGFRDLAQVKQILMLIEDGDVERCKLRLWMHFVRAISLVDDSPLPVPSAEQSPPLNCLTVACTGRWMLNGTESRSVRVAMWSVRH